MYLTLVQILVIFKKIAGRGEDGVSHGEVWWIALDLVPGLGPKRIASLHAGPGIDWFFSAGRGEVADFLETRAEVVDNIRKAIDLEQAASVFRLCQSLGIQVLSLASPGYPSLLRSIYDPPPVLYYMGRLPDFNQLLLAMVGSRKATAYGRKTADKLAGELAQAGVGVVSGLALGIDTSAHRGCLEVGGYTVGVLGNGLNIYYPYSNRRLQEEIARLGCLISEFPPNVGPRSYHFPRRNRIVSGLCRGVVVVEASIKSGAMITVGYALDQGRDVFSVPGNVNSPESEGTNRLIQQGAVAVLTISDILSEYGLDLEVLNSMGSQSLSVAEKNLLAFLDFQGVTVDDLCNCCRLPGKDVLALLVSLELKGLAVRLPGQRYARTC